MSEGSGSAKGRAFGRPLTNTPPACVVVRAVARCFTAKVHRTCFCITNTFSIRNVFDLCLGNGARALEAVQRGYVRPAQPDVIWRRIFDWKARFTLPLV